MLFIPQLRSHRGGVTDTSQEAEGGQQLKRTFLTDYVQAAISFLCLKC